MNSNFENAFVNDFILFLGDPSNIPELDNFFNYRIDNESILFYKYSKIINNWSIKYQPKKVEIHCQNSFYPFFVYKKNNIIILTPNYEHIFKLAKHLSVNYNAIREFILFHIPLENHTFHNEVIRLKGVTRIILQNRKIEYDYDITQDSLPSVYEQFYPMIEKYILATKNCSNCILLSGGGESRINAAASAHYNIRKEFITWGHPENSEYLIASKIAKRLNTKHINVRPTSSELPYDELLIKCGYLSNMQYAYRYSAIKTLFENLNYDAIWTGWGDINGFPSNSQSSELFSKYYINLFRGSEIFPIGWNQSWLKEYAAKNNIIKERIQVCSKETSFFYLKNEIFSPTVFGQVLSVESTLGTIISPWFHPLLYISIQEEETKNNKLITSKLRRTIWKNELYFQLVKTYFPSLNYIKNAKGYYPWLPIKALGFLGLLVALSMKKWESRKPFPFDPVEDKKYLIEELKKIEADALEIFSAKEIQQIIKTNFSWKGPEILEYFKLIQINKFLKNQL